MYLFLGLQERTSKKKPSALKRERPALQNMQFLTFFLLLWVIFALLETDPEAKSGSGNGSTDLIESGPNPDPDPKHCLTASFSIRASGAATLAHSHSPRFCQVSLSYFISSQHVAIYLKILHSLIGGSCR
jgi:hypothetical protein